MRSNSDHGHHRLRIGRHSQPGQLYLLTTVTHQRRPWFRDIELARLTARSLALMEHWQPSQCLCWVLMPDHWHGLVELAGEDDLARVMKRMKGSTSRIAGLHDDRVRPLWAKGYHDRALRRSESVVQMARYIIANPIRAGLVDNTMDYPYWDAVFIETGQDLTNLDPGRG